MSHDTNKWAQDQTVGGVGPKATLVCIASFADEAHSCYPGQAKIAAVTEQSVRTVRGHIAALEEAGYLCRKHRLAEDGRGRTSDRFYLHVEDCKHCDQPAKSAASSATNRQLTTDQPATDDRPTGKAFAYELPENYQRTTSSRSPVKPAPFPDAFNLTPAMVAWATEKAPGVDLDYQTHQFADYWRGRSDVKRTDWVASWRTWIRRAKNDMDLKQARGTGRRPGSSPFQTMAEDWQTA